MLYFKKEIITKKKVCTPSLLFISILVYVLIVSIQIIALENPSSIVPIFKSEPVVDSKEGSVYTYKIETTGFDSDFLEYSPLAFPAGMTIDSSRREINWIPSTPGSFEIKAKASDREECIIQAYSISVKPPFLTSIKVLPSPVMYLDMNQSMPITSITAFYDNDNGNSKEIELSDCVYQSEQPDIATVDEKGIITGVSNIISVPATITVSYTQDNITKKDSMIVIVNPPFIVFWGIDQSCAF